MENIPKDTEQQMWSGAIDHLDISDFYFEIIRFTWVISL
jgi:hypothetical protein